MKETWSIIPNTNQLYEASSFGCIRRVIGYAVNNNHGGTRAVGGNKLMQKTKSNGYKEVNLYPYTNSGKMMYVHRAVYSAFNGEIPIGLEINHIDGDKSNNNLNNLELVTPSQNMKHAFDNNLISPPIMRGENHPMAKLNQETANEIKKEYFTNRKSIKELCKIFPVSRSTISRLINNQSWSSQINNN